jgi:prepilin-type N-terminal cleavage/methylation domain-containing protein
VKKGFSLMEVLIAVVLLSVVIAAILKMQQNNLFFIEQFKESAKNDEYISVAMLEDNSSKEIADTSFYLHEVVDFKDDEIRKKLKEIKVKTSEKEGEETDLSSDDYQLLMKQYTREYEIESRVNKVFYRFELEY